MGLRIERSKKGYREDRTAYDYRMYANHQIATPTENWLLANATRYFAFVILAKEGERKAFAWFNFSTLCHCTNVFAFFWSCDVLFFVCLLSICRGFFCSPLLTTIFDFTSTTSNLALLPSLPPPLPLSPSLSILTCSLLFFPAHCCAIYKECVVACSRAILFHFCFAIWVSSLLFTLMSSFCSPLSLNPFLSNGILLPISKLYIWYINKGWL